MKNSIIRVLIVAVAALLAIEPARAHFIWIEPEAGGRASVFFGEVQEGVREKTGGRLDEIANPVFTAPVKDGQWQKLPFTRKDDRFAVSGVKENRLLATESTTPVQDLTKYGIGVVKPMFYARTEAADAGKPHHTLDVVPTGEKNVYRVYFRGQPLPKAKVMVYAPNLWMMERVADDSGQITIETPWPGLYVLDIVHKEETPGRYRDLDYQAVRHRATCSLTR
jgi:hypothetical protein